MKFQPQLSQESSKGGKQIASLVYEKCSYPVP